MTRHPNRPHVPCLPLTVEDDDQLCYTGVLWRAHRTRGPHVLGWDTLRRWGPAANCRWEPHTEPPGHHSGEVVLYAATDLATAVLETFQDSRRIDPNTGNPKATSWAPTRALRLLNLTDDWCLPNGASASLASAPHATCRAWVRAIRTAWPDLDGLWTSSVLTGRPNITLWQPAADTFPGFPAFSEHLGDDPLWDRLDRIAYRYRRAGYRLI